MSAEQQQVQAHLEQPSAIADVNTAVAKFDRVAAGIATLREQYQGVLYDVTTTKGMAEACKARAAIREPRYEVERVRKECKAPILALGRDIDSRAAKITEELLALEGPIDEQITAEQKRKDDERKAKAEAERVRVANIQAYIEGDLRYVPTAMLGRSAADIEQTIRDVVAIEITADRFAEFVPAANAAKEASLIKLREMHARQAAHEAEQQRLAAERSELELQRLANEEAARKERERIAAEEAEAKRQREAEAAAAAVERKRKLDQEMAKLRAQREENERAAKAERERLAEERRQQEAAADERQRVEQQRIDAERAAAAAEREKLAEAQRKLEAERAELERQQQQMAVAQAQATEPESVAELSTTAETAAVAAKEFVPSRIELVAVIAAEYGISQGKAESWLVGTFGGAA